MEEVYLVAGCFGVHNNYLMNKYQDLILVVMRLFSKLKYLLCNQDDLSLDPCKKPKTGGIHL